MEHKLYAQLYNICMAYIRSSINTFSSLFGNFSKLKPSYALFHPEISMLSYLCEIPLSRFQEYRVHHFNACSYIYAERYVHIYLRNVSVRSVLYG